MHKYINDNTITLGIKTYKKQLKCRWLNSPRGTDFTQGELSHFKKIFD